MNRIEIILVENTWLPGMEHGWGNGYVNLPKTHKWYGKQYDNIPVDIHGGLTYSGQDGESWRIGFDTVHLADNIKRWPYNKVAEEVYKLYQQCL